MQESKGLYNYGGLDFRLVRFGRFFKGREGKGFEICTAGFEFELGHVSLVRA